MRSSVSCRSSPVTFCRVEDCKCVYRGDAYYPLYGLEPNHRVLKRHHRRVERTLVHYDLRGLSSFQLLR